MSLSVSCYTRVQGDIAIRLALAVMGFVSGLVVVFWFLAGNAIQNELIIAQDEPTKENLTYTVVVDRFWKRGGGVYGSKDVWEIYGVNEFQQNDDFVVDRFWYSPILDEVMERWMNRGNVRSNYGERLFIEGVERALIDIPGCPLILMTDKPYRRLAEDNWWSLIVPHEREETYSGDMLRCERTFLNELTQDLDEKLNSEVRALEDELKQLEKEGNFLAVALRSVQGHAEVRRVATQDRFEIALLRFDSLLRWVTGETHVDLWEPIESQMQEPSSESPTASPEAPDTALLSTPTITPTE